MSRRGRRLRRRIRGWRPMRVEYVLTNWKLRVAYLVVSVGMGAWEALSIEVARSALPALGLYAPS
jgi:hypothetical protein